MPFAIVKHNYVINQEAPCQRAASAGSPATAASMIYLNHFSHDWTPATGIRITSPAEDNFRRRELDVIVAKP